MSAYGEDYDRRLEELVMKHNALVQAYEAKTVQEHDLAIWWEARKAYMQGHFALDRWQDVSDSELDQWADFALERYKAKAAELRDK